MDARRRRGIKKASLRQERQTAEDIGGRTQANSGATRLGGGADVRGAGMRVECKFTEKDRYALKYSELKKVRKQAIKTLEFPVLQFAFSSNGRFRRYAVIPWQDDDKMKDNDTHWMTSKGQILLAESELNAILLKGRFQFMFTCPGPEGPGLRLFEIAHWDDFMGILQGHSKPCEHAQED